MKEKLIALLIDFLKEQGVEHDDLTPQELAQVEETAELLAEWCDEVRARALTAAINALGDVDKNGVRLLPNDFLSKWKME